MNMHYAQLSDRLVLTNGMILHSRDVIKKYRETIYERFSSQKLEYALVASRLALHNPFDGKLILAEGHYHMNLETLEKRSSEILRTLSNFYCAQAYEAFESFLIDISIQVLEEKFGTACLDIILDTTSPKKRRAKFRNKYRENEKKIELLRSILPSLEKMESSNANSFDYATWFKLFSVFRHSVTHSHSRVHSEDVEFLDDSGRLILMQHFGIDLTNPPSKLRMYDSSASADMVIKRTIEYAYLIINSMECNSSDKEKTDKKA